MVTNQTDRQIDSSLSLSFPEVLCGGSSLLLNILGAKNACLCILQLYACVVVFSSERCSGSTWSLLLSWISEWTILTSAQDHDAAQEKFEKCLELEKNQPMALLYLGRSFYNRGKIRVCLALHPLFVCLQWQSHASRLCDGLLVSGCLQHQKQRTN